MVILDNQTHMSSYNASETFLLLFRTSWLLWSSRGERCQPPLLLHYPHQNADNAHHSTPFCFRRTFPYQMSLIVAFELQNPSQDNQKRGSFQYRRFDA